MGFTANIFTYDLVAYPAMSSATINVNISSRLHRRRLKIKNILFKIKKPLI